MLVLLKKRYPVVWRCTYPANKNWGFYTIILPHVIAHFVARSEYLYFLYPSLKFLSSHNLLRNFFSPSRGENKILHLAASLLSCLAASDTDFASSHLCIFTSKSALLDSTPLSISLPRREELCLASKLCLAASLPSCLAASNTDFAFAHLCLFASKTHLAACIRLCLLVSGHLNRPPFLLMTGFF